jgi:DMSO/TMAO reductase YedYZ molybdopterin-dependent catalytic subunit
MLRTALEWRTMANDRGILGKVKAKLVETKQKWAREGRLLTGANARPEQQRLPPGQREVKNWPVLWNWSDFIAQPQVDRVSDIHCVTQWSRYGNRWQGVRTIHLLDLVKPRPEARFVIQHSYDGYTTNLPLADFAGEDVLLAHQWEGAPITLEHGGPVRLVLPALYFWKSAKWLTKLSFVAEDQPGFWELRGYHMRGDPWKEERYAAES